MAQGTKTYKTCGCNICTTPPKWASTERGPMTKVEQLLREMRKRDGMRYTDIQRFLAELAGLDFDEKSKDGRRRYRGFYSTVLTGGTFYPPGLLHIWCDKWADGKWRVKKGKRIRAPFYPPKSSDPNLSTGVLHPECDAVDAMFEMARLSGLETKVLAPAGEFERWEMTLPPTGFAGNRKVVLRFKEGKLHNMFIYEVE